MNTQVGACPQCGAPTYSPTVWDSTVPRPVQYTCICPRSTTLGTAPITTVPPAPRTDEVPISLASLHAVEDRRTGEVDVESGEDPHNIVEELQDAHYRIGRLEAEIARLRSEPATTGGGVTPKDLGAVTDKRPPSSVTPSVQLPDPTSVEPATTEREPDEYLELLAVAMMQAACWGAAWDEQDEPTREHWRRAAQSVIAKTGSHRPEQQSAEREPDGFLTPYDVRKVRDSEGGVPSVNVWKNQDSGDIPVYIGSPPPEQPTRAASRCEQAHGPDLVCDFCSDAPDDPEGPDAEYLRKYSQVVRAETLAEVRRRVRKLGQHASPETVAALVREDEVLAILDRLSTEGGGS